MCNCIEKTTDSIIARLKEDIEKTTKIKSVNLEDSDFDNIAFSMSKDGGVEIGMPFTLKYTPFKKDGTWGSEKSKRVTMYASYCPFCGKKKNIT